MHKMMAKQLQITNIGLVSTFMDYIVWRKH